MSAVCPEHEALASPSEVDLAKTIINLNKPSYFSRPKLQRKIGAWLDDGPPPSCGFTLISISTRIYDARV